MRWKNILTGWLRYCVSTGDDLYTFYDLAGKSRNNHYPDLAEYIGKTEIVQEALRRARDLNISISQWQNFIDEISGTKKIQE